MLRCVYVPVGTFAICDIYYTGIYPLEEEESPMIVSVWIVLAAKCGFSEMGKKARLLNYHAHDGNQHDKLSGSHYNIFIS